MLRLREAQRSGIVAVASVALLTSVSATRAATSHASEPLARVPIVFERNQVRVPVSIDGSPPFHLVLDTGMPTRGVLLYRTERVDALELRLQDHGQVSGAGGTGQAYTVRVASGARVEIGGLRLSDAMVMVIPSPRGFPNDSDGIIGLELFERFAVRIDTDERRLDLFDPATFKPEPGSSEVPLRLRGGTALVDAKVSVNGDAPVAADLALDLGAGHAMWLNCRADGRFAAPAASITTSLGRGLSGDIEGRIGRVRRVELGPFAFDDVVAVFPSAAHQQPGGGDLRDGLVGAELLTRFRLTFDYAGSRMILEPSKRFREPFEHDMSGMVLDPAGGDHRVVRSVITGSPAEMAGVVAGDVLVAVDEKGLGELGSDGLKRAMRIDGAEVRVTLERGSSKIEKRFKLRRLV